MRSVRALSLACTLSLGFPAYAVDALPRAPGPSSGKSPPAPGPVLTPGPVVTPADPWADAMAAFATADTRDNQAGGVVFVGSSSIRLWTDLEKRYRSYAAINRGFGGSTLADCVKHMDRLVLPHRPRLVIIYAGDNDLAGGRSAEEVLLDFVELTSRIQERLPKTQIVFVSIKPSPARVDLLDRIRETNTRIRNYIATKPYLKYIDVFTPMLDAKGKPRGELFGSDSLHLNEEGYALWHALISPVLPMDEQPAVLREAANPPAKAPVATAAPPTPKPPVATPAPAAGLAKAPASPATLKVEVETASPVPVQEETAAPAPAINPPTELATAPSSPPRVKANVEPAAPVPAPPPLIELPEPPDESPAAPQAVDGPPDPPPPSSGNATDGAADEISGGSNPGGTNVGTPAPGTFSEANAPARTD